MAIELPDTRQLSDEMLEALRERAIRARDLGFAVTEVAAVLGVSRETVSRWCSAYARGGYDALPGDRPGRPVGSGRSLSPAQEQRVFEIIRSRTPDQVGVASSLWTRAAVRDLIRWQFGIRLAIRTIGTYLERWGLTPQRPTRKAYKQDPAEVQEWLANEYPAIETRAAAENAEIHWGDETAVRSTCHSGRGYAPPGQTPELAVPAQRFSVNMISTVTPQGKVRFMLYDGTLTAVVFICFLKQLIAGSTRKIFLIVDNLKAHDSGAVQAWLAGKEDKIEAFFLPNYSPELNPDEYLNCDVKANINRNGLPKERGELKTKLRRFMQRLAKLPERVASYFQHPKINYASAPA